MVVLTEEMLIARTKQSNLKAITKLNCWGSQLSDVSILRRMSNVEVLSLSVNSITSLADFQFCKKLQHLYVRKNNIADLNEVVYLKDLEHLKHLWLGENPCSNIEGYRLAVIRTLPTLQKLDDDVVDQTEVQKALRIGRVLVHPEEAQDYYSEPEEEYDAEYVQATQGHSPPPEESPVEQPSNYSPEPVNQYYQREYVPNNTNNETEHYNEINKHAETTSDPDMYKNKFDEKQPDIPQRPPQLGTIHRSRTLPQSDGYYSQENSAIDQGYRNHHYSNDNSRNSQPNVHSEAEYSCNNDRKIRSCQSTCCIQNQKRPNERRTNVLNAVLCLVKELDYPNLEVVQMAVKCRMEELSEM